MTDTISADEYNALASTTKGKSKTCAGCGRPKVRCECLELRMLEQIRLVGLPLPEREVQFSPPRRWRFDFGYPDIRLAIECEGGTWTSGAHSRGKHYESDCDKYNQATLLGWSVLRFTTDQIYDGRAIAVIEQAVEQRMTA